MPRSDLYGSCISKIKKIPLCSSKITFSQFFVASALSLRRLLAGALWDWLSLDESAVADVVKQTGNCASPIQPSFVSVVGSQWPITSFPVLVMRVLNKVLSSERCFFKFPIVAVLPGNQHSFASIRVSWRCHQSPSSQTAWSGFWVWAFVGLVRFRMGGAKPDIPKRDGVEN